MNFHTSNPAISSTWKQGRFHYVGLAAGIALAVTAAAAFGGYLKSERPTGTRPSAMLTAPVRHTSAAPVVLVVLDDAERAAPLTAHVNAEAFLFEEIARTHYRFVVVENEAQQRQLNESILEQMAAGTPFEVIDLRAGLQPLAASSLLPVLQQAGVPAFVIEGPESIAAGEAWQHGSSLAGSVPAPQLVIESPESIAAGEAWHYGVR